jgi:hypothetical protein
MEIVFIIGIALFILFGPWVLLWRFSVRRKSDRLDDQSRWSDLSARVSGWNMSCGNFAATKPRLLRDQLSKSIQSQRRRLRRPRRRLRFLRRLWMLPRRRSGSQRVSRKQSLRCRWQKRG